MTRASPKNCATRKLGYGRSERAGAEICGAARYSGYSRSGRRVRCPDWSAEVFDATVGRMFGLKGMT